MKQSVRYKFLTIPNKLKAELKIMVDVERANPEYSVVNGGNQYTNITFFPTISLTIIRETEVDDNGQKIQPLWNPNDTLSMTKYNFPIFLNELKDMDKNLKTPELYTYHGKRLELNEEVAEKIRRPFQVGNMMVELSATIINTDDDQRIEGIKMKFNNEQSAVLLTLNDLTSLIMNCDSIDIDSVAMLLFVNWINRPEHPKSFDQLTSKIDIIPKSDF